MSNEECDSIAKRISKFSDLPMECREARHQPIIATSGLFFGNSWESLDDYSGN